MNTTRNNTQANFRARLIAFLVVLAVGFVMGWFNTSGNPASDASTSDVVSQQVSAQEDEGTESADAKGAPADAGTAEQDGTSAEVTTGTEDSGEATVAPTRGPTVEKDGWYTSKEEVALYIHTYGRLPGNFISKTKARDRGWEASEGNLDEVCPGMSIGGSRFYNDEGQLPDKGGRQWTECDINYHGGYRGSERIVFSNDGLVYYTQDHYQTFERLY